ncbi:hypothetical protein AcV5_001818 [Taiwanofungus camphoratus]|nr:hypothetical protein AcV5_001818 [Antrodia cinnamomea]
MDSSRDERVPPPPSGVALPHEEREEGGVEVDTPRIHPPQPAPGPIAMPPPAFAQPPADPAPSPLTTPSTADPYAPLSTPGTAPSPILVSQPLDSGPSRPPTRPPTPKTTPVEEPPLAAVQLQPGPDLSYPRAHPRAHSDRRAVSSAGHGAGMRPEHATLSLPVRAVSHDGRTPRARERQLERSLTALGNGLGPEMGFGNAEVAANGFASRRSGLDYMIPVINRPTDDPERRLSGTGLSDASMKEKTLEQRLGPTLKHAEDALVKYQKRARTMAYALNICIGMQVIFGAVTTGVAAATSGRQTSIATAVLGGLSTLAASYLARARGSGEPEASTARCKDLENFIREVEAFKLDKGHLVGPEHDVHVARYRGRFEEIMSDGAGGMGGGLSGVGYGAGGMLYDMAGTRYGANGAGYALNGVGYAPNGAGYGLNGLGEPIREKPGPPV